LSGKKFVALTLIEEKWKAINLPKENYNLVCQLGNFKGGEIEWVKFMAISCSTISKV
jgi:hypothetical protein